MVYAIARKSVVFASLCIAISASMTESVSAKTSPPHWFWGCWVMAKTFATDGISGLSQNQVNSMLGRHVLILPNYARSSKAIISSPRYSVSKWTEKKFFEFSFFPLKQIGVDSKQVTVVSVDYREDFSDIEFPAGTTFLRKSDIVFNVENVAFLAEKAKPQDKTCNKWLKEIKQ